MISQSTSPSWLDQNLIKEPAKFFRLENLLIAIVLLLAILSRFVMLGERVMSHDEVNHVVPSYELYQGRGYRHDPVTHGPFQFHAVALSYFLFGDSDYSSRIPAALFSVSAVAFIMFAFRRYLGRSGAIITAVLFLISPYMMFYGRYTRNEAFIELVGVMLLYAILRYLEKGDRTAMFLVTISTALHFCIKETAFIYTAQALIFLFFMFLIEARRIEIRRPERYNRFLILMVMAMALVMSALALGISKANDKTLDQPAAEDSQSAEALETPVNLFDPSHLKLYGEVIAVVGAIALGGLALFSLAADIGWAGIKNLRSFSLLILISTLILPMLSPLPVSMLGWNPLDYVSTTGIFRTGAFIFLFFIIAAAIGVWWNPMLWLQNMFAFYIIFTVFYTTFFTNGNGFFTGLVGSLGYWLSQQGVERGTQPKYYYALIQMPIYEFLAYQGTVLAIYFGIRHRRMYQTAGQNPSSGILAPNNIANTPTPVAPSLADDQPDLSESLVISESPHPTEVEENPEGLTNNDKAASVYASAQSLPVLGLFLFWAVTSLAAYSLAGERMPWLTVHITMGFLLSAGWGLGFLIDTTDWKRLTRPNSLLALLLFPVLYASLASLLGSFQGSNLPFQGQTIDQLQATSRFLLALIGSGASAAGIFYFLRDWESSQVARFATAVFFALMAVLTVRAAYRASFINYDYATEYLVYAHAAPGPKEVLRQVEEISRRIYGDKSIPVAYSSDALYPYWWYFRDFPNHRWFQSAPTRDLRELPVIIAGEDVFNKMDSIVGDAFIEYDYIRLWWPNQDYYNLTWPRIWGAIKDPKMREAIFKIWLNRDYSDYATLTNQAGPLSKETWSPAARMRVYIRRDIVAKIWNYGVSPAVLDDQSSDPYAGKMINLSPIQVVGSGGAQPGQFQAPRGIKIAPDGSIYVADSRNQRIEWFASDGSFMQAWGSFADQTTGQAPGGTFNEPWDVAVGKDGSVYVSDTWNHRVQKFTADGKFITMWGYFGQAEDPQAFWGPRGLAIDSQGRIYVMDTGNKRVVIFDPDGNYIAQFGSAGFGQGQFDEPVGIAIDSEDNVYITDTWNQRIQVMAPGADGLHFTPVRSWDFSGWSGQSLENKPFLAISPVSGHVFVTDPESSLVVEFDAQGNMIRAWGGYSSGPDGIGMASGVAVAANGDVWVSDGANNVLLRFQLPQP